MSADGQIMLRQAKPTDASDLSELAITAKAHWGYSAEFIDACRGELTVSSKDLQQPNQYYQVAELDGTITGFYALEYLPDESVELDALFVSPRFMGQGIGQILYTHATDVCRRLGYQTLLIQSDPHALGFYQRCGATPGGFRESHSVAGRQLPLLMHYLS